LQTLHSEELEIIGLPVYDQKRNLVERVVEGVAELFRGASSVVLWSALERLLSDGLNEGGRVWAVVVEVTSPGPITNSIFQLVKSLEGSEKPEGARLCYFFKELLRYVRVAAVPLQAPTPPIQAALAGRMAQLRGAKGEHPAETLH
jgi:hypothetical protein